MSNTAVSTLFQKYLSQHSTINTQSPFGDNPHTGAKREKPPPNPILGTQCGGLDLWLLISQHYPESR